MSSLSPLPPIPNQDAAVHLNQPPGILDNLQKKVALSVVGQDAAVEAIMIALLSRGHCLLVGVPGLAKTLLVRVVAHLLGLHFSRVQFTPDLMPSDITGTEILQEDPATGHRQFVFGPGPVFTQVLLADEINRTPPKTQAALLEAMQEKTVTLAGKMYGMTEPFLVLATQNPIEQEGTYPLPEAQLDRFLFLIKVDYPSEQEEQQILMATTLEAPARLQPVITASAILASQELVRRVPVSPFVANYA